MYLCCQILYRMQDPMDFRQELTRMGIHAKFNRGELLRHMRNMHLGKVSRVQVPV